jgi:methylated-DNA-[protein]-cysteine S-methyltransferase
MYKSSFQSPFGYIRACSSKAGLYAIDWQQKPFLEPDQENGVSRETIKQIKHYLNGQLSAFTVPLDLSHYSPAFVKWLSVLSAVPFGHVITYKEFARRWGNIKAARAAGQACKRNPLPIILPCHRIVQVNGKFDNYSVGNKKNSRDPRNIEIKQWLVDLESKNRAMF